ncbi:MAG: hypothetical protein QOJ64_2566 [Acidobacteriota bacterium]|nr:hypothetical protein [Acidobacteriota bacterium]
MAEVPEAGEENDVVPVEDAEGNERAEKQNDFNYPPKGFAAILPVDGLENRLGIIPEKAEEHVTQRMFRFAILPVLVNREPVDGFAMLVRPVGIPLVMLHVHAVVKGLAETDGDRLEKREEAVQERPTEVGVVNEVVRDAVDVPGDADRIDEPEDQHDPERRVREQEEHPEEVGEVEQLGEHRDDVPAGEREDLRIRLEPLGGDVVDGVHADGNGN